MIVANNSKNLEGKSIFLPWVSRKTTAILVLEDGTIIKGQGFGKTGETVGEICFNTACTGYQEILTDPSYMEQIITFTFPHIGNTGINEEDLEHFNPKASHGPKGVIVHAKPSSPSNYRATQNLNDWLKEKGIIGIYGVDTRSLTSLIREKGALNAALAHCPDGKFDIQSLKNQVCSWGGLAGLNLSNKATCQNPSLWNQTQWKWNQGYGHQTPTGLHIVAIDYGIKRNILRLLAEMGAKVTVVPSHTTEQEIQKMNPDGVVLSNGPGDPDAMHEHAIPVVKELLLNTSLPILGICLGHQILALALGGKTEKMHQGHHGANHPVKEIKTGRVMITSMNHGFTVIPSSLPSHVEETHVSLFDGSNCGLALKDQPVFSVQYHPESSPGPHDSYYVIKNFIESARKNKT